VCARIAEYEREIATLMENMRREREGRVSSGTSHAKAQEHPLRGMTSRDHEEAMDDGSNVHGHLAMSLALGVLKGGQVCSVHLSERYTFYFSGLICSWVYNEMKWFLYWTVRVGKLMSVQQL
jgi:hypothetical protein